MTSRHLAILAAVLALAGCDRDKPDDSALAGRDPAVAGALGDPLMTDPDLASQNRGNAALSGGGPASGEMPLDKRGQDEVDAARAAAIALLGGTIPSAPMTQGQDEQSPAADAPTAVALAQALPFAAPCAGRLAYSAVWAARLPARLPVYPRAHVREAAGADDAACHVRVVRFVTPVTVNDVIDFYHASARAGRLPVGRRKAGEDEVIGGGNGPANWLLFARQRADGLTEAQLVTAGI